MQELQRRDQLQSRPLSPLCPSSKEFLALRCGTGNGSRPQRITKRERSDESAPFTKSYLSPSLPLVFVRLDNSGTVVFLIVDGVDTQRAGHAAGGVSVLRGSRKSQINPVQRPGAATHERRVLRGTTSWCGNIVVGLNESAVAVENQSSTSDLEGGAIGILRVVRIAGLDDVRCWNASTRVNGQLIGTSSICQWIGYAVVRAGSNENDSNDAQELLRLSHEHGTSRVTG